MICKFRKRAGGPSVGGGRQILLLSSWNIETSMVGRTSLWMGNWPRIAIKSYFEPTLHTNTVVSFIDTEWFDNSDIKGNMALEIFQEKNIWLIGQSKITSTRKSIMDF